MNDLSSWMEYSAVASKKHRDDTATSPNNSMGNHHVVKLDLIVDVYIDPITERHMTICSKKPNTPLPDGMKQVPPSYQSTTLDPMVMETKHLRDSPRKPSASSQGNRDVDVLDRSKTSGRHSHLKRTSNIDSNSTGMKHNGNIVFSAGNLKRSKDRKFVSYPKNHDVERALGQCRGLSQLLALWTPVPRQPFDSIDRNEASYQTGDDQGWLPVDDVERTLLRCRFSSDGSKPQILERPYVPGNEHCDTVYSFHRPTNAGGAVDRKAANQNTLNDTGAISSDSSSVSSLSFPEQQQALPPTLLRVSTSTILEEQELIWTQIQQDRQNRFESHSRPQYNNVPRSPHNNVRATWNHEVTRSHNARPPLSPQSRISMHSPKSIRSFMTKDAGEMHSLSSRSFMVPSDVSSGCSTPKLWSEHGPLPALSSLASTCSLSPHPSSPPARKNYRSLEIGRFDLDAAAPPVVTPCIGCQSLLTLPDASTIVYCSKCGTMASTDLMRSLWKDNVDATLATWTH